MTGSSPEPSDPSLPAAWPAARRPLLQLGVLSQLPSRWGAGRPPVMPHLHRAESPLEARSLSFLGQGCLQAGWLWVTDSRCEPSSGAGTHVPMSFLGALLPACEQVDSLCKGGPGAERPRSRGLC